jgi:hypothetical protein
MKLKLQTLRFDELGVCDATSPCELVSDVGVAEILSLVGFVSPVCRYIARGFARCAGGAIAPSAHRKG